MSVTVMSLTQTIAIIGSTHRKEMKSDSFEKVMTLLLSSFGTGNKYFRMSAIRVPRLEEKLSNMRCGYCSETVETL